MKLALSKKETLFFFAAFLIALLLAEGLLWLGGFSYPNFHRSDTNTGVALWPGAEGWWQEEGRAYVRINAQGMRDDRDISVKKPEDVYRIAVLGDSYAEALQVDVSKTFWRLLETKLQHCGFEGGKRIEVLNFGVSGYSPAQEFITLKTRVAPYHPDLVLLAFLSGNDVRDSIKEIAGFYPRPYFVLENGQLMEDASFREHWIFKLKSSLPWQWLQAASKYSRLIQLTNKAKNVASQLISAPKAKGGVGEVGLDDHIYLSNPPPVWQHAWQLTEALISEIKRESERQGAGFLLVTLTTSGQVPPDSQDMRQHAAKLGEQDLFYPERRMQGLAEREGMDAVFLAEQFARYAVDYKSYLHGFPNTQMGWGHWNEAGHSLAAERIAQHLCIRSR
jgi:hypothetical protein